MTGWRVIRAAVFSLLGLAIADGLSAQGLNFADQSSGAPVEIYADQGLELSQDAKTVIARGNAKAIRGRVTVSADVLTAHYRDKTAAPAAGGGTAPAKPAASKPAVSKSATGAAGADKGGDSLESSSSEIWRVEADGHVVISTPTQAAYGDHADYNIDDAVVVLTGKNLHITTPTDTVTARDSLEYWENRQQAVARGQAVAVRGDRRIQADILVANFAQNENKQTVMRTAVAYNHVVITTATDIVTGDRADYNAETGIVTVTGSVKITRGNNQLNGGYAVVNLNTGISRIYPAAPGASAGSEGRVKGLFVPERKNGSATESPAPSAKAPGDLAAPPPPPRSPAP